MIKIHRGRLILALKNVFMFKIPGRPLNISKVDLYSIPLKEKYLCVMHICYLATTLFIKTMFTLTINVSCNLNCKICVNDACAQSCDTNYNKTQVEHNRAVKTCAYFCINRESKRKLYSLSLHQVRVIGQMLERTPITHPAQCENPLFLSAPHQKFCRPSIRVGLLPACTHNTLGRLHSFPLECTIFLTFLTVHFPLRLVGQGLFCREEISYAAGCCGGVRSLPRGEVPQQFKFMQIR